MVTHAKRSVYIIHFKCIASLSHLDFGTSPSIQLCPDLTTVVHVGQKLTASSYWLSSSFETIIISNPAVLPIKFHGGCITLLYHVFTAASLFETEIYNLQYYCAAIVRMSVERRCRGRTADSPMAAGRRRRRAPECSSMGARPTWAEYMDLPKASCELISRAVYVFGSVPLSLRMLCTLSLSLFLS